MDGWLAFTIAVAMVCLTVIIYRWLLDYHERRKKKLKHRWQMDREVMEQKGYIPPSEND